MLSRSSRFITVQAISIFRLLGALVFAMLAFQAVPIWLLLSLYLAAAVSDLVDGFLARRMEVTSFSGRVIDVISDKSMTVVSLLYAAASDVDLLPLSLIACREIISLGLRLITVSGTQILATDRTFGGLMALALWGNTAFLVLSKEHEALVQYINLVYWIGALIYTANLAARIYRRKNEINLIIHHCGE